MADPTSRAAADSVLTTLDTPTLAPLGNVRPSSLAPAPTVSGVVSGQSAQHGGCIALTPLPGAAIIATLTLPDGGVAIRDEGSGPGSLAFRRFGESFDQSSEALTPQARLSYRQSPIRRRLPGSFR